MDERSDLMNSPTWRRSAAALAAALPGLVTGTACKVEDEAFRVTRIEFDDASTITLTFSRPVAELGMVDPNDFRISAARTISTSYTYDGVTYDYAGSNYVDISYILDYGYGYYGPMPFQFASAELGASANQIVLTTEMPLGPDACQWVSYVRESFEYYLSMYDQDGRFDIGLFLHYAAGEIPIEAQDGSVLGDIAPDWALTDALYNDIEEYGFPNMRPQLRIPCPD